MRIKLIENGEFAEVDDSWGERLIEHGKAVPAAPKSETPKAKAAVATKAAPADEAVKGDISAEEEAKPATEKKAGKKR